MWKRPVGIIAGTVSAYVALAYFILPAIWRHHEHQPGLARLPMVTTAADGIPGDPLNIGLVGAREDVVRAMRLAGWSPADPITLRSSMEIMGSVMFDRPYRTAPVSTLFYRGVREDLAFELPAGHSAKQRHHVRIWKVMDAGVEGVPVWLGSATFDRGVALSLYTGQLTHAIAPDIDAERDFLSEALTQTGVVDTIYKVSGVGPTLNGRNAEGTRYHTDGEIRMLVLVEGGDRRRGPARVLLEPSRVRAKDAAWQAIRRAIRS